MPVREVARSGTGSIMVHADWDEVSWPLTGFPLRLDGEVRPVGASTSVLDATIQPVGWRAGSCPSVV